MSWISKLNNISGIEAKEEQAIYPHTPLRVGGPVDTWIRCQSKQALLAALPLIRKQKWRVLWPFQDVLLRDQGVKGIVIRLEGEFEKISYSANVLQLGTSALWAGVSGLPDISEELQHWPGSVGSLLQRTPDVFFKNLDIELEWIAGKDIHRQTITNWKRFQLPSTAIPTQLTIRGSRKRKTKRPQGNGFIFSLPKDKEPATMLETLALDTVRLRDWKISEQDPNRVIHLGTQQIDDLILLQKALNQRLKQVFNTQLHLNVPIRGKKK